MLYVQRDMQKKLLFERVLIQFKFLWRKGSLKQNFLNKSSVYPEKTKSLKPKLSFKLTFWTAVNEKGVFRMWRSGRDTSKEKRKS